jgi:hypothetical protein
MNPFFNIYNKDMKNFNKGGTILINIEKYKSLNNNLVFL